mgnify:CR=1 FL=1
MPACNMGRFNIWTDGSSYGNPGPAGYGYRLDMNGKTMRLGFGALGTMTNNEAEYIAVKRALEEALVLTETPKSDKVIVNTDSQLLVRHNQGKYNVQKKNLVEIMTEIVELQRDFKDVVIRHIGRKNNVIADFLANQGSSISREQASND